MDIKHDKIAVIDYEMGNLFSVVRACEHVGLKPVVTSEASTIMASDALILPGVGAFGDAMQNLKRLDLVSPIKDHIASGKPFLGICLGLQLLLSESEEFGSHKGLDIVKGTVVRFPTSKKKGHPSVKVPQVGWNRIYRTPHADDAIWERYPLKGVQHNTFMYFVHSFYVIPEDSNVVLTYTNYEGTEYASSILKEGIFACQFHPEKSAMEGMKIYKNFAELVNRRGVHARKIRNEIRPA